MSPARRSRREATAGSRPVAAYHAMIYGHGVKVSNAHNGMQLCQDTTNAYSEFSDNQSECALRTFEVTH